ALSGLNLGASFTNVPGGTANWTFTDATGNYNNATGSVGIVIR
ncbi:MAG: filamentous haemagglutinin family outer membrane protein, partial [uncultured Chloroflexia bacterium]